MTQRIYQVALCLSVCIAWALLSNATQSANPTISILSADTPELSLDGRFEHFVDAENKLSFENVSQLSFIQKNFKPLHSARSLGYDTDNHWFYTTLAVAQNAPKHWVLAIGTPELEVVEVWVGNTEKGFQHHILGYQQPYESRPLRTRLFAAPIDVFSGAEIFLRVKTTNAINVHATLWQVNAFTAHETRDNFFRGGYFGILLIVTIFYCIFGLRSFDVVLLSYAGYIASQGLFHLGTNGYLPVLLGNDGVWATDALPRIGWIGGSVCIALMWDRLLDLKDKNSFLHRFYLGSVGFNLLFLPFALLPFLVGEWLLYFVKLANAINVFIFSISMWLLFSRWLRNRKTELMIYFVAFAIPVVATAVNSSLNQGWLPWNPFLAEFYQAATLVHIVVMSYGLALRLRQLQVDKNFAEQSVAITTQRAAEQRRFVAMLSHEFGNPLAAIDRAAQMIQIKASDLATEELQRLHQIRSNASTLSGFVSNFLRTEALAHDAVTVVRKPCAIAMLISGCLSSLDETSRNRIRVSITPQDLSFSLDASLVQAALNNLIINALRYSPSISVVDVVVAPSALGLNVHVIDNGSGLSEQELQFLGQPYFRASSSQGKAGSGLGYYFARHIVEAHGGTLIARSSASGGLAVEIFLP